MDFLTKGKTNWQYIVIFAVAAVFITAGMLWYISGPTVDVVDATGKQNPTSDNSSPNNLIENGVATPKVLAYGDAVKLYGNKRIQFDPNCNVVPNKSVFNEGTKIMLDNRSDKSRSVYLDRVKYILGAYSFKTVVLTTTQKLPRTILIDCGTGRNNGQIILQ